jgi:osmoprotectant transport system permease protein
MKAASALLLIVVAHHAAAEISVGSKRFTESYVLGEIATKVLRNQGLAAEHRQGMGGTIILWEALKGGAISAPGIHRHNHRRNPPHRRALASERIAANCATAPASRVNSDSTTPMRVCGELQRKTPNSTHQRSENHPDLRLGFTHEFLERQDGWKPLSARYSLAMRDVRGVDHGLGYAALADGSIDVKDAYSTDAKIAENDLVVLEDDAQFFPQYQAVFLYRLDLDQQAISALKGLEHTLDESA